MDKYIRNAIERATQDMRRLLEEDFAAQLEGDFDVHRSGTVATQAGVHLTSRQAFQRERIVGAIEHKSATGLSAAAAVADYLRDAAFTTLNRFAALKMLEARELVQECVTKGEQSAGYREFCGMASALPLLPNSAGYRLYIECLFDDLSTEVKVLFDRRDPSSVLWPKRATFEQLLEILNRRELALAWGEDETIGWVYQYFNGQDERRKMRDESQTPRTSRELAVRNQFFTPRYVVQFLVDNTLGRIWYEMQHAKTTLADDCEFMVLASGEELTPRSKKDARDLLVLDPACGSGHFLLYAFDVLLRVYEDAYADDESPRSEATGRRLREDYPTIEALRHAIPALILGHNLHGVDIDPRCAQIAQLALWMRAQKAYSAFGITRTERPRIRRSNIVVAEPLVADSDIAREFVSRLDDVELARLFSGLIDELKLAGDLGLLLEIETLAAQSIEPDQTGDLFALPEERIRAALERFITEEGARATTRYRLFADDTAHGIGLLGLAEKKFDVILMNPPFGEPTASARGYIDQHYHEGANDIYAAFVLRFSRMLSKDGRLGAITSRSFFVGRDLRAFRRHILDAADARIELVLDLGLGVLDAMVETAAYVLGSRGEAVVRFLDARTTPKSTESIREAMAHAVWRTTPRERFRGLPNCQFLYDISDEDAGSLASGKQIEPTLGRVTKGLSTGDDERFVRLRWEVVPLNDGDRGWELFSKGGEYGWFGSDVHLLIKRHAGGAELAAQAERTHGNISLSRQSSTYYGRTAVTWSRRSQKGFSARRLRPGVCFSDKSPVIIPSQQPEIWVPALLASLATDAYLDLIYAQSKFGSYETGAIKTLPVPDASIASGAITIMNRLFSVIDEIDSRDETCQLFVGPPPPNWDVASMVRTAISEMGSFLHEHGQVCSHVVAERTIESALSRVQDLTSPFCFVSYALGVALGRWDGSVSDSVQLPGPLEQLPHLSQAEIRHRDATLSAPSNSDWFSDDEGTPNDVVAAVVRRLSAYAMHVRLPDSQLREQMRKAVFAGHLAQYSKSARKAPVYWQLASASASYSAWIYYHRMNADSLFRLQKDYAEPKVRHEEHKLVALRGEFGASPTATQRRALAGQELLVEELRAFLDEVKRAAPLWRPHFDDGVIINFAPLWRLVPHHKAWQKELKRTWDALCKGDYDWAHLAMRLWPERVVRKCANDRSLAIAHGLEKTFWVEESDGKWSALKMPARRVEELVRERTSPAVKAALNNLLDAPPAIGNTDRGGHRRSAAVAKEEA